MLTCPFQPRLDHHFVGTFHYPTANWPPLSQKTRILHLRLSLLQIRQILGYHLYRSVRSSEAPQALKHAWRTVVFEVVQLPRLPGSQTGMTLTQHGFANLADALGGMRKIQDARSAGCMKIDEALYPFCSVIYARNLLGGLDSSAIQFTKCQALKHFSFRHS